MVELKQQDKSCILLVLNTLITELHSINGLHLSLPCQEPKFQLFRLVKKNSDKACLSLDIWEDNTDITQLIQLTN